MRSPFLSSPCGWQTLLPILRAESQAESANRPKSGHPTALPVWKPLNCRYQNAWSSKQRGGHCLRHKIPHRQSCCGRNSLILDMGRWKNLKCVPKGFNYLHGHQSGSCLRPLSSSQASKYNKPAPLWLWSGTVFMASSTELNCFMSTLLLQRVLFQGFLLGGLFLVPSTRRATFSMQRSPNSGTAAFQKEKPEDSLKTSIFRRYHTAKLITYRTRSSFKNNVIQSSAHLLSHEAVGVLCHE